MKQRCEIVRCCMPLILILVPVIAFCTGCHNNAIESSIESVTWTFPPYFYYEGKKYTFSKEFKDIVSELPEGYTYAGTIYDSPNSTEDFAGNFVADVYMYSEIPDVAYVDNINNYVKWEPVE